MARSVRSEILPSLYEPSCWKISFEVSAISVLNVWFNDSFGRLIDLDLGWDFMKGTISYSPFSLRRTSWLSTNL